MRAILADERVWLGALIAGGLVYLAHSLAVRAFVREFVRLWGEL